MVLFLPLIPHFPLVATHPTEHQWYPLLVGEFHDVLTRNFRLPTEHIQSKIFHVAEHSRFAVRVISIQEIGRINGAAYQEILAIHIEIEISAFADGWKLLIVVAVLGNRADAEPDVRRIGEAVVFNKFESKLIETGVSHGVRPPQIGIAYAQLGILRRSEACLTFLARSKGNGLFDLNGSLTGARDCPSKNSSYLPIGMVSKGSVDR